DDPDRACGPGRNHAGQPLDPQDRQGARDPLLDAGCDLRRALLPARRPSPVRATAIRARTTRSSEETKRQPLNACRHATSTGNLHMKHNVTLTITSLLSVLLFTFHWVDEIARGMESGGTSGLGGVLILVVWLCGTLVLAERRSGYIIMLLGSILGLGVLILHMSGAGLVGGRIAHSSGIFFWVWTLLTLGVTSTFSGILSARGLWSLRRGQPR